LKNNLGDEVQQQTTTYLQTDERQFLKQTASDETHHPLIVISKPPAPNRSFAAISVSQTRYFAHVAMRAIKNDIAEESARGTEFLFTPIWLGIGAIAYFTASFEPTGLVLLTLISILLALRVAIGTNRNAQLVTTMALLIAIGAGCAKLQSWRMSTPMLGGEIATEVTARIVSINPTGKSHRAILEIIQTTKPVLKYAPQRVRVTLRQGADKLNAGETISVRLRLMPPSGPVRPTSYDFAFQSYFDGIGASGFSIGPITIQNSAVATSFDSGAASIAETLEQLRQTIASRIRASIPGTQGEVAVALIAGVQAGIDEKTMESLRITGLAHILSISGLHMALVAGLFMVAVRAGFALFPNQAANLPVKKFAAALALFASFFYLLLSGSDVAALRSFIMLAVFLVAIVLDQQALTMRNLTIAAIAILIVTPHEIMGPSFQMSFAATAALISAYAFWTKTKGHLGAARSSSIGYQLWNKSWRFLGALAMTSIIAGSATSLFSAWHFHRLAPMGLPANLIAMPPVSLIVMPSAVASALAMPFGLEEWPLKAMGSGINMMLAVSNYFAGISSPGLSGALNTIPFYIATATLLIACLLQTRLKWVTLLPIPIIAALLWQPHRPDILISEDAKLVAVRTSNNTLAVNRTRPNAFTMQAWEKAQVVNAVTEPSNEASQTPLFVCNDLNCTIHLKDGTHITWLGYPKIQRPKLPRTTDTRIALAETPTIAQAEPFTDRAATEAILAAKFKATIDEICGKTDLLVIEGPAPPRTCNNSKTQVISARDLALQGAAEIYLNNDINAKIPSQDSIYEQSPINANPHTQKFQIQFAIGKPNRPWNYERKFSRAARNLPPFQPIPAPKLTQ
jgi:ComEC/Rec2-related protein